MTDSLGVMPEISFKGERWWSPRDYRPLPWLIRAPHKIGKWTRAWDEPSGATGYYTWDGVRLMARVTTLREMNWKRHIIYPQGANAASPTAQWEVDIATS